MSRDSDARLAAAVAAMVALLGAFVVLVLNGADTGPFTTFVGGPAVAGLLGVLLMRQPAPRQPAPTPDAGTVEDVVDHGQSLA